MGRHSSELRAVSVTSRRGLVQLFLYEAVAKGDNGVRITGEVYANRTLEEISRALSVLVLAQEQSKSGRRFRNATS